MNAELEWQLQVLNLAIQRNVQRSFGRTYAQCLGVSQGLKILLTIRHADKGSDTEPKQREPARARYGVDRKLTVAQAATGSDGTACKGIVVVADEQQRSDYGLLAAPHVDVQAMMAQPRQSGPGRRHRRQPFGPASPLSDIVSVPDHEWIEPDRRIVDKAHAVDLADIDRPCIAADGEFCGSKVSSEMVARTEREDGKFGSGSCEQLRRRPDRAVAAADDDTLLFRGCARERVLHLPRLEHPDIRFPTRGGKGV